MGRPGLSWDDRPPVGAAGRPVSSRANRRTYDVSEGRVECQGAPEKGMGERREARVRSRCQNDRRPVAIRTNPFPFSKITRQASGQSGWPGWTVGRSSIRTRWYWRAPFRSTNMRLEMA